MLRTNMCTVTCVNYIFLISFFLFSRRESSVLRTGTWDLCLRLLTKLASLQVLATLASSPNHVPTYDWFKGFLFDKLSDFEGHSQRKGVANVLLMCCLCVANVLIGSLTLRGMLNAKAWMGHSSMNSCSSPLVYPRRDLWIPCWRRRWSFRAAAASRSNGEKSYGMWHNPGP